MQYTKNSFLKRLSAVLLALLLGLPLVFVQAETVKDSLSVGIISSKTTKLMPLLPEDRDFVSLYGLVYESLLRIGDNGLPEPYLAKDIDNVGGNTLNFEIRDDVSFSNGQKLTAYDIAASGNFILERAKNEEGLPQGHYSLMRYNIKSFQATSETQLTVLTERPYFISLYSLTFPVVPANQVQQENPAGSGPYVIDQFEPGKSLWLKANASWWKQHPQVETILVSFYQNTKKLVSDFEYGRLDTAITRSLAAAQYKSGVGVLSLPYRTNQLEVLLLNNNEYRLKDAEARRAIMKAIDLNAIGNRVFAGRVSRAYTPFPSASFMYADLDSYYQYNLEEARQTLENLGWNDNDDDGILDKIDEEGNLANFALRLLVYEDPENSVRYETALRIKSMLERLKISVRIELKSIDQVHTHLQAHSFDMALVAFQMDDAFDPGFLLMSSNAKVGNFGRYKSKKMDTLMAEYREQTGLSEIAYKGQEIQLQFTEDLPFIPLFYRMGSMLTRKVFTNARDIRENSVFRGIEEFNIKK